eukprot:CAMPEP_0196750204 /NCGR_PEP_ID=MMETSP1091-20130531/79765_1 /TAXON_ID=302021 /ORGANISM="Rhodomonas sp., Strain CCMP768" /LENGTH=60 /DNA_ID=CAMNT_0042097793 /DNA_START=398 /DNA_END=580 /DNA_ORIENTATION=-
MRESSTRASLRLVEPGRYAGDSIATLNLSVFRAVTLVPETTLRAAFEKKPLRRRASRPKE